MDHAEPGFEFISLARVNCAAQIPVTPRKVVCGPE